MTYTTQVVHSGQLLLSMILVYGKHQRLLAMAHLIGPDCLPCRNQLDTNLVSHHSSDEEESTRGTSFVN